MRTQRLLPAIVAIATISVAGSAQDLPIRSLAEEVRIVSDASSPQRTFATITGMTVLSNGSMVLFQHPNANVPTASPGTRRDAVRIYDASGRFIRSFGTNGNAPGEFFTMGVAGSVGDTIWVHDTHSARIILFRADGSFIAHRNDLEGNAAIGVSFTALLQGNRRLTKLLYGDPVPGRIPGLRLRDSVIVAILDSTGHIETALGSVPVIRHQRISIQQGRATVSFSQPLAGTWAALASHDGSSATLLLDADLIGVPAAELHVREWTGTSPARASVVTMPTQRVPAAFLDSVRELAIARRAWPPMTTTAELNGWRAAFMAQFHQPEHFPVIMEHVTSDRTPALLGSDRSLWINDVAQRDMWTVVVDGRATIRVRVPLTTTLHAVSRDRAWGVVSEPGSPPTAVRFVVR